MVKAIDIELLQSSNKFISAQVLIGNLNLGHRLITTDTDVQMGIEDPFIKFIKLTSQYDAARFKLIKRVGQYFDVDSKFDIFSVLICFEMH